MRQGNYLLDPFCFLKKIYKRSSGLQLSFNVDNPQIGKQ